ncbi:uncharacterized protein LOC130893420 isoform X2 [Diorhabda carinulata]|uniref:uncharacterized protein LOC130893420 isoform X2 n=1 Tax=Diorhabda carinulata TaxID=1163345 RepID=UPI0025A0B374|nr:uncharacterized protein LOC130893420 isoform X2 [Diorhabda carinulata]
MSGEYYGAEQPKFYDHNYGAISPHSKNDTPGPDIRLNDIEEQLEIAEDKCNTLKGQLDYMKHVYGTKKKTRKVSSAHQTMKTDEGSMILSTSSVSFVSVEHKSLPKRQNSNAIGTDHSGAAVETINTILSGITNSVNRLSEIHVKKPDSPGNKMGNTYVSTNVFNPTEGTSGQRIIDSELIADKSCVGNNYSKKKSKDLKGSIRKQASSQLIRKCVKVDRKINSAVCSKSFSATKNKMYPIMKSRAKLVEIFHNREAKNSDSEECQINKQMNPDGDHKNKHSDVPILELSNDPQQNIPLTRSNTIRLCQNVLQDEYCFCQEARRSDSYRKNYELPTIASRMKQVAKTYLSTFSFKTMVSKLVGGKVSNEKVTPKKAIPFCAAISTSPSHNIGINIQQVMNILKNRQPVNGISPTLAHNIGLAAERLNSKPLSTLVTTINSNTCYLKPQQCPLSKCKLNYQYLQDLAKSIPEETVEEVEGEDQQPEIKTLFITGPSGDVAVKCQNFPQWSVDPSENNLCTCVPNAGADTNYNSNKILRKSGTVISSQMSIAQKTKDLSSSLKIEKRPHTTQPISSAQHNMFEGKERSLKIVLTHLHDEFEALNKQYEELSRKAIESDSPEMKQLESLESVLVKKEEEICMVMNLCQEVIALKQQIKTLKQNNSQCNVPQDRKDNENSSNCQDFNNPRAAFHLTKLLKQIQTYQLKYKNGVGA